MVLFLSFVNWLFDSFYLLKNNLRASSTIAPIDISFRAAITLAFINNAGSMKIEIIFLLIFFVVILLNLIDNLIFVKRYLTFAKNKPFILPYEASW